MGYSLHFTGRMIAIFVAAAATFAQSNAGDPPRVDNHGDPLPNGAVARFGTVQFRRPSWGSASAIAADGKTFLDVDDSLVVRTYDLASGRLLKTTQLPGKRPQQLHFSQNGRVLVGQIWDSQWSYHAWDVESGKEIGHWKPPDGFWVINASISFDGDLVALATQGSGTGKLVLWEPARSAERTIGNPTNFPVILSQDGKRLYSTDGTQLFMWDVATGKQPWIHRTVTKRSDVHPSPDGKSLLRWSFGNVVTLQRLDAATGGSLAGDTWPKLTGEETIALLPDGRVLIGTKPKGVRVWDPAIGKETLSLPDMAGWLAVSPDGKSIVGIYQGGGELQRWDLSTGKELWPDKRGLGHTAGISRLAFDSSGRRMATLGDDLTVRIWDMTKRRLSLTIPLSQRGINVLTFAPDGEHVFASDGQELVQIGAGTGHEVNRLPIPVPGTWVGEHGSLASCRVSSDGRNIMGVIWANGFGNVGSDRGAVVAWEAQSGKVVFVRDVPEVGHDVTLSPNGAWYVGPKGRIRGIRTDRDLRQLMLTEGFHCGMWSRPSFAVSRDSYFVAAGISRQQTDNRRVQTFYEGAQVWDVVTGQQLARVRAGELGCIALSPDGRTLATADWDSLCGWDVATGEQLWKHSLGRVARSIYAFSFTAHIEFTPDGKTIATAMPDSTVLLWSVPPVPRKPTPLSTQTEKDAAWEALISPKASKSIKAAWGLADAGADAVAMLRERMKPIQPIPKEKMQQWLNDLNDPVFAKREAATRALTALGERSEAALRAALAANPSPEQRSRMERLLAGPFIVPPETIRFLRAVQALEGIGSPAACKLLQDLATGDPSAPETKAASTALSRQNR
ncbi:MAG TPA: WD40 repeat domain-containing protein [Gemmataceae bacterium]|nr:WD40 repeat domain-containing protein [Gemmataceae bacterium]